VLPSRKIGSIVAFDLREGGTQMMRFITGNSNTSPQTGLPDGGAGIFLSQRSAVAPWPEVLKLKRKT
jgi:hypothetical protein